MEGLECKSLDLSAVDRRPQTARTTEAGEGARSEVILDWLGAAGGVLEPGPPGGVLDLALSRSGGEVLPLTRS